MVSGVIRQIAQRFRTSGAALVGDDDAIVRRIKKPPMRRRRAGTRPAMDEQDRGALRITGLLPIQIMRRIDVQPPTLVRLHIREEISPGHSAIQQTEIIGPRGPCEIWY